VRVLAPALALLLAGCAAASPQPANEARVGGSTGSPQVSTGSPRTPAVVIREADVGGGARYAGSEACRDCHREPWERWRATGHASDFAGLGAAERTDPACLRCHVTGHGDPLGHREGGGPDLASVGCEACHGPAAEHAESRHPAFVPTAAGGPCPPCETSRICRLCHTPARSPDFDLARYLPRVSCSGGGAADAAPPLTPAGRWPYPVRP